MVCVKYTWGVNVWEHEGTYFAYDVYEKRVLCEGSKEKVDHWFDEYLDRLAEKLSW